MQLHVYRCIRLSSGSSFLAFGTNVFSLDSDTSTSHPVLVLKPSVKKKYSALFMRSVIMALFKDEL